jgi:hypothetical protein
MESETIVLGDFHHCLYDYEYITAINFSLMRLSHSIEKSNESNEINYVTSIPSFLKHLECELFSRMGWFGFPSR